MVWPEAECLTLIDRSTDALELPLEYSILSESPIGNAGKCEGEAEESRTIQFVAFCEDPGYPSAARIYATDDGAADLPPQGVLETSDACWTEITDAAGRRPTKFDANLDPVLWDITDIAPGTYTIWALTLAPPFFVWLPRQSSVVKIHDGDPHAVGPGLAITSPEMVLPAGDSASIEGCIHALPGTTLRAEFSSSTEDSWTPFADNVDIDANSNSFTLSFVPPTDMGSLEVRVTATDPEGRSFTAYAPSFVTPVGGEEGGCEEGASFLPCPGSGDTDAEDPSSTSGDSEDTDATEAAAEDDETSGCRVGAGHLGPMLLVLALATRVRRRRPLLTH